MLSSTFDLTEYVRLIAIEHVDHSQFELSSTFDPKVELYPFGSIHIAFGMSHTCEVPKIKSRRDGKTMDDDCW